jgi:hypothetical protein
MRLLNSTWTPSTSCRDARQVLGVPAEGPDGWTPIETNLDALLACFPALRLRPGIKLVAYQYRESGNGNGIVWAAPISSAGEPVMTRLGHELLGIGPRPPDALDDFMEAIEGDQTLWAYLSASILARELGELGALWHGVNWGAEQIIGAHPEDVQIQRLSGMGATHESGGWAWHASVPKRWPPTVRLAGRSATVTFYTYCEIGTETIRQHVDQFRSGGSMRFERVSAVLARGRGGLVF